MACFLLKSHNYILQSASDLLCYNGFRTLEALLLACYTRESGFLVKERKNMEEKRKFEI